MRAIDAQYGPTRHVFKTVFLFDTSFNSFMSLVYNFDEEEDFLPYSFVIGTIQAVGDMVDPEMQNDPAQEPVPTLNPI